MKPRESSRNKKQPKVAPNLIEDEAKKLQERLEELRRQVQSKKNAKASMNSTGSRFGKQQTKEIARFLNTASDKMVKKPMEAPKSQLTLFYEELKMQHLEDTLKQAAIHKKEDLENLTQLQIQKLPIPPGFRIKLKKALIKKTVESPSKQPDIEAIIEKRNVQKEKQLMNKPPSKFKALEILVEDEDVFSFNTYDEGELVKGDYTPTNQVKNTMFLETIRGQKIKGQYIKTGRQYMQQYEDLSTLKMQPLRSCLKQTVTSQFKKPKMKKQVRFSADVIGEGEAGHLHKKYPKQGFSTGSIDIPPDTPNKGSSENIEAPPKVQFCSGCFKAIKQTVSFQEVPFCSNKCMEQYKKTLIKTCTNCQKQVKVSDLVLYEGILLCEKCADTFREAQGDVQIDLEF